MLNINNIYWQYKVQAVGDHFYNNTITFPLIYSAPKTIALLHV
jgi:hypothetical protein